MDERERAEQELEAMEETLSEPALTIGQAFSIRTDQGPDNSAPVVPSKLTIVQTKTESSELLVNTQDPVNCLSIQNSLKPDPNQAHEFLILDQNGLPLHCERMVILTGESESREVYVIPSNQLGAQVLLPRGPLLDMVDSAGSAVDKDSQDGMQTITLTAVPDTSSGLTPSPPATNTSSAKVSPSRSQDCFTPPLKPLPANAPSWAHRLRNGEKIGDSYRGFCATEAELETILLHHKQQTSCVFGTRQSPSPAKPATRLMWKSQYVPYDGIPFVNAGSRAIVMECQYGPRRKGLQPKKTSEQVNIDYKATCPARIYIKKVQKFPEYRVPTDPKVDKKVVRQEQEKAFSSLRKTLRDAGGVLRYYMQLPTQKAHLYHDMEAPIPPPPPDLFPTKVEEVKVEAEEVKEEAEDEGEEEEGGLTEDGGSVPSRLHPRVAEKIRELVAHGHHQVYTVRKQLRKFVEREMFKSEEVPERHNLCYFPTVNDIKNHIHEAQKTLQLSGALTGTQWGGICGDPLTETVTLTLTPATAEGLTRGVLEGSDTLSPEAVQLFSSLTSLQPKIFAQLQGIQLQPVPALYSYDGALSQSPPITPSATLTTTDPLDLPGPSPPQPLLVNPSQFLQAGPSRCEGLILADTSAVLGMGPVVSMGGGSNEGRSHPILLEDRQIIPVQIVDPATVDLTSLGHQAEEQNTDITINPGN
ncbi:calcium-responsive transcription factor isoform X3 [Hypomesus transpacificus]|uniref:calcium-responsive transcription factor isoform X3 n=1 Tax=Hypomesus transpacificus TaxID=137520 RepID=UPI001F08215A|nr:calcium-responsive transcription factor isoform X3 [Hypomesus transpacificus]